MERAAITMPFLSTPPEKLGFGLLGLLQGQFCGDRDVSVQFGIEANSCKLVFPRITAPAALSMDTI